MKKFFGLGKGLGSLIPAGATHIKPEQAKENVFYVEVHKIRPNPDQPRRDFDETALKELAVSIRKYGVLQPLLVSKMEEESSRGLNVYYQLIAGERRLRAAMQAGIPQVPVIIRDDIANEKGRNLEVALIENIQRKNLNPMEEAEAFERLSTEFGLTQAEIGTKVSKSREVVANTLRLLKLPKYIKDALRSGKITMAHARALLAFDNEARQRQVYDQILAGGFSSKDVEDISSSRKGSGRDKEDRRFVELERNLGEKLNAPVLIRSGMKGGRIIIRFATHEELNGVVKRIID